MSDKGSVCANSMVKKWNPNCDVTKSSGLIIEVQENFLNQFLFIEKYWEQKSVKTILNFQFSTSGHKIHLMHGQVSDSGNYTCVATNEAGEARSNMKVIVLGKFFLATACTVKSFQFYLSISSSFFFLLH